MGEFPAALLPQAIFEGQIKALIVVGANPAVSPFPIPRRRVPRWSISISW